MTLARDYRLIGATQFAALSDRIAVSVKAWNTRWFLDRGGTSVEPTILSPGIAVPSQGWWPLAADRGMAYVQMDGPDAVRMLAAWLTPDDSRKLGRTDPDWCMDFVFDLVGDLVQGIAGMPGASTIRPPVSVPAPNAFQQVASGAIMLRVQCECESMQVLLDADVVANLLHPPTPRVRGRRGLCALPAAIEAQRLSIRIGGKQSADVSIDALQQLAVGDVILLGRSIETPWDVLGPDQTVIAKAFVGQAGGQRMVKIISAETE